MFSHDFNNNTSKIKLEINSPSITTKPQPNGSNILLKGTNGKSLMVFIPSSSPLHNSYKPIKPTINSLVIASVKSKNNSQIHDNSYMNMSIDLSFNKSLFHLPNDLSIKNSNRISTLKRSSTASCDPDIDEESLYDLPSSSIKKMPRLISPAFRDVPLYNLPLLSPKLKENIPLYLNYNEKPELKNDNQMIITPTEDEDDDVKLQNKDIILGPHGTKISTIQFDTINWNSIFRATKQLLYMLFSREILATHSLSGKPAPLYMDLGCVIKPQLNPKIIADIIYIIKTQNYKINGKTSNEIDRKIRIAISKTCGNAGILLKRLSLQISKLNLK